MPPAAVVVVLNVVSVKTVSVVVPPMSVVCKPMLSEGVVSGVPFPTSVTKVYEESANVVSEDPVSLFFVSMDIREVYVSVVSVAVMLHPRSSLESPQSSKLSQRHPVNIHLPLSQRYSLGPRQ